MEYERTGIRYGRPFSLHIAVDRYFGTGGADMNNTIQYKGYVGSVEFSEEDSIFYGKVLGIRSLISYDAILSSFDSRIS